MRKLLYRLIPLLMVSALPEGQAAGLSVAFIDLDDDPVAEADAGPGRCGASAKSGSDGKSAFARAGREADAGARNLRPKGEGARKSLLRMQADRMEAGASAAGMRVLSLGGIPPAAGHRVDRMLSASSRPALFKSAVGELYDKAAVAISGNPRPFLRYPGDDGPRDRQAPRVSQPRARLLPYPPAPFRIGTMTGKAPGKGPSLRIRRHFIQVIPPAYG